MAKKESDPTKLESAFGLYPSFGPWSRTCRIPTAVARGALPDPDTEAPRCRGTPRAVSSSWSPKRWRVLFLVDWFSKSPIRTGLQPSY